MGADERGGNGRDRVASLRAGQADQLVADGDRPRRSPRRDVESIFKRGRGRRSSARSSPTVSPLDFGPGGFRAHVAHSAKMRTWPAIGTGSAAGPVAVPVQKSFFVGGDAARSAW